MPYRQVGRVSPQPTLFVAYVSIEHVACVAACPLPSPALSSDEKLASSRRWPFAVREPIRIVWGAILWGLSSLAMSLG
jgi:hypothetical protein